MAIQLEPLDNAWSLHRSGDNRAAIAEFQKLVQQDSREIDVYFGLGLAQRADGQFDAAIESFQKGLEIAGAIASNLSDEEDDRYAMITRMLKQRIEETQAAIS